MGSGSAKQDGNETPATGPAVLFHCTRESHPSGFVLGPYERSRFSERLECEGKQWVDQLLLHHQPREQPCSRVNAVYAADSAANAAIFLDGEGFQEELRAHLQRKGQEVRVVPYCYEVQAAPVSKAPMALIRSLELAKAQPETASRIAVEYWIPTNEWGYWEYFAPCMTIVRPVEWPSTAQLERAKDSYKLDRQRARRLWGC